MERHPLILIAISLVLTLSACSTGASTTGDADTTSAPTTSTTTTPTTTTPPSTTTTTVPSTTTTAPPTTTTTTTAPGTIAPSVPPIGEFADPPVHSDGFPTAGGPTALLDDLRHAPHDGFERVVYEFQTGDDLAYRLEIVDEAVPPSGDPVPIEGETVLQVVMTPASGFDASGGSLEEVYEGPDRLSPADSAIISEMVLVEDFENTLVWAIGLDEEHPVAAAVLTDPLRLVVDVESG